MRAIARQLIFFGALAGCPTLLMADMAEDAITTRSQAAEQPANERDTTLEVDHTKPAQVNYNFSQPQVPEIPAKTSAPVALLPLISDRIEDARTNVSNKSSSKTRTKTVRKRKSKTLARRRHNPNVNVQPVWWERSGNEVVFAFRDCLGAFAEKQSIPATTKAPRLVISRAMDEECREAFDTMATKMLRQFGRQRFDQLSEQLIAEVFVPAVAHHIRVKSAERSVASDG